MNEEESCDGAIENEGQTENAFQKSSGFDGSEVAMERHIGWKAGGLRRGLRRSARAGMR
jgi:hypothetical protein